jgi:hypothetical protein
VSLRPYGRDLCDAYHGGLIPPLATVDLGRRQRVIGLTGGVRFLCDKDARGLAGWRDKARMPGAPGLPSWATARIR